MQKWSIQVLLTVVEQVVCNYLLQTDLVEVLYYWETVVCSRNYYIGSSVSVNIDNVLDIVNISLHLIQWLSIY